MHELVILAVRPFLKMFTPSCSQRIRKVSGIVRCCTCKYFEFYWNYWNRLNQSIQITQIFFVYSASYITYTKKYLNSGPDKVEGVGDKGGGAASQDCSTALHGSVR